jgi:hypothetical protein
MRTRKISIRYTKENFSKRRKAIGASTDWELRALIQSGKNGVASLSVDEVEIAVNELEKQNLGILQRDLVKSIELEVPIELAERFDRITNTALGQQTMWRKLNAIDDNLNENLEEMGQEYAERRLESRKRRAKSDNGPKLILEDNQEDI